MPCDWSPWRCPKCGANLLTDGKVVVCSFVGGPKTPSCDYGVSVRVTIEQYQATRDEQEAE